MGKVSGGFGEHTNTQAWTHDEDCVQPLPSIGPTKKNEIVSRGMITCSSRNLVTSDLYSRMVRPWPEIGIHWRRINRLIRREVDFSWISWGLDLNTAGSNADRPRSTSDLFTSCPVRAVQTLKIKVFLVWGNLDGVVIRHRSSTSLRGKFGRSWSGRILVMSSRLRPI